MSLTNSNEMTVNYATGIQWSKGVPRVVSSRVEFNPVNTALKLSDLAKVLLNFPYDGDDPKYAGLTKGEAMMAQLVDSASSGDSEARKELMDRVMGRPQQNIKSVSVKGTLTDFLDQLDVSEVTDVTHAEVMDL